MNVDLLARYYDLRAPEYDAIYQSIEWQPDFANLGRWLQREVAGKEVLEIACGTGHWTAVAHSTAPFVVGIDINESMLQIARRKFSAPSVHFIQGDAHNLPTLPYRFSCGMAHSWLSHLPKPSLSAFVNQFSRHLQPRAKMLFIDGKYILGRGKPFARKDTNGNTYQVRTAPGNLKFEIIKNFLPKQELFDLFTPFAGNRIHYQEFDSLWALSVQLLR